MSTLPKQLKHQRTTQIASMRKTIGSPEMKGENLGEVLKSSITLPSPILTGLATEGKPSLVRVDKGVYAGMYAVTIAATVATGKSLPPFGLAISGPVLFAFGGSIAQRVIEQINPLSARIKNEAIRILLNENLFLYRFNSVEIVEGSPGDDGGLSRFESAIPTNCKLVVFLDVARCLSKRASKPEVIQQFIETINGLNKRGIATLIFFQAGRKGDAEIESELFIACDGFKLELTTDRGAPSEFGSGFTVYRPKTSERDTVPTCFQVWYTVINDELQFGWECRDPHEQKNAKQVEIAERQKRVQDLLASGMQQKEVAAFIGVNSATVSRDVSEIKAKSRAAKTNVTGFSPAPD